MTLLEGKTHEHLNSVQIDVGVYTLEKYNNQIIIGDIMLTQEQKKQLINLNIDDKFTTITEAISVGMNGINTKKGIITYLTLLKNWLDYSLKTARKVLK